MTLEQLLENLNPQIVASLKRAIELGKWPNGTALDRQQRALCIQAVVRWEHHHLKPEDCSGYVPPKATPCNTATQGESPQPLHWKN